jgi:small subunit ribosomal protein S15
MITTTRKKELVEKFGKSANDSGSVEVQVAILTERIKNLTPHFNANKQDKHSKRGMMKMIGRRRSLLRYLNNQDQSRYQSLIKELGLRK